MPFNPTNDNVTKPRAHSFVCSKAGNPQLFEKLRDDFIQGSTEHYIMDDHIYVAPEPNQPSYYHMDENNNVQPYNSFSAIRGGMAIMAILIMIASVFVAVHAGYNGNMNWALGGAIATVVLFISTIKILKLEL